MTASVCCAIELFCGRDNQYPTGVKGIRVKILILGGTVFVGRHLVEAALQGGHDVTLFNRGQHGPELFPDVEKLRGDRDGDLEALRGRRWDVVIDTSGYVPRVVRASAELLAKAVDYYVFISTISVYPDTIHQRNVDENGRLGTIEDETTEEVTGETYGPLKVLCEQAVERALPGRTLIIRPGLIVGPDDPTDRFTYWPVRVARGGEVLAPRPPDAHVQFIDVRDLAEWIIRLAEDEQTGIYNATGPDYPLSMGQVLEESKRVSGSDAHIVWVDEAFLLEHGVEPWVGLPLWIPNAPGFHEVNVDRALAAGLTFRLLDDTIRDTLAWHASRPADTELRVGLSPDQEQEVLRAWHEHIEGDA